MEHTNAYEMNAVPDWSLLREPACAAVTLPCRRNVLIVDSSPAGRLHVRAMLGPLGHEVIEVASTSDAIAAISVSAIDLVLVDIAAPENGATDFCRKLRKASATQFLPIFVTASSDDLDAEVRAIEAGADEFLITPLRQRAFQARVQASLRHKTMLDSLDDSETVLFSLAQSVEERDSALGLHCQRLALMSAAMGLALGLPGSDVLALQRGGYLHDIGKLALPDNVLFKAGPLTPEEWKIMQSHAERGERICANMRSLALVLPIIRHHHERWDGSGYPDKLRGDEIPLLARILQLADIYDALTTARPYKKCFSPDDATAVIREEVQRGWRDPRLVEVFMDVLPTFRTSTTPDISRVSLHALASSIAKFRGVSVTERSNTAAVL